MSVIERSKCPTCGGDVVIHTADEGTSHMVPANSADQTEAFIERDQLRGAVDALRELVPYLTRGGVPISGPDARALRNIVGNALTRYDDGRQ